jgi:hypothetical protein
MGWISDHADLDDPALVDGELDDHTRPASRRENESAFAFHQSELRRPCAPLEDGNNTVVAMNLGGELRYFTKAAYRNRRLVRTQNDVRIEKRK